MLGMLTLWLFGTLVLARITLHGVEAEEYSNRNTRFNPTVLSRALVVL
jgi:hypothetical protein